MKEPIPQTLANISQARRLHGDGPKAARQKDDFYSTPPEATRALLAVETFEGSIWEPACGKGHISRELELAYHEVLSTDLVDRGFGDHGIDFLMEWTPRAPNIITNPPFKLAEQFVEHALRLTTGKVCMLLKLSFLEGTRRRLLLEHSPLARVWVFSWRVTTRRDDDKSIANGMIPFAWFVWEHGYQGTPTLGWL